MSFMTPENESGMLGSNQQFEDRFSHYTFLREDLLFHVIPDLL